MTAPVPDHASLPVDELRRLLAKPVDPYEGMSSLDAWRAWFRESGLAERWAKVDCIECELDRPCLKNPPCANAIEVDD